MLVQSSVDSNGSWSSSAPSSRVLTVYMQNRAVAVDSLVLCRHFVYVSEVFHFPYRQKESRILLCRNLVCCLTSISFERGLYIPHVTYVSTAPSVCTGCSVLGREGGGRVVVDRDTQAEQQHVGAALAAAVEEKSDVPSVEQVLVM